MASALRKCLPTPSFFSVLRNTNPFLPTLNPSNSKLFSYGKPQSQEIVPDYSKLDAEMSKKVFDKVNEQISKKSHGRLFAVVQVQSGQYKITTDDIIVIPQNWAPTLGDKIRLEKVLLVGCSDFTLIGRPILPLDQVTVIATVIEKTLSHTIPRTTYRARKNDLRQNFLKIYLTLLRINSITLTGKVNELGDTDGLVNRIF